MRSEAAQCLGVGVVRVVVGAKPVERCVLVVSDAVDGWLVTPQLTATPYSLIASAQVAGVTCMGQGRRAWPEPIYVTHRRRPWNPSKGASQRTGHGVTCDAELACNSPPRQPLAAVQMPDQRPVFQEDQPSNLIGWPTFQPSRLAGLSTVVNTRPGTDRTGA